LFVAFHDALSTQETGHEFKPVFRDRQLALGHFQQAGVSSDSVLSTCAALFVHEAFIGAWGDAPHEISQPLLMMQPRAPQMLSVSMESVLVIAAHDLPPQG
jgi:hypothetical protein